MTDYCSRRVSDWIKGIINERRLFLRSEFGTTILADWGTASQNTKLTFFQTTTSPLHLDQNSTESVRGLEMSFSKRVPMNFDQKNYDATMQNILRRSTVSLKISFEIRIWFWTNLCISLIIVSHISSSMSSAKSKGDLTVEFVSEDGVRLLEGVFREIRLPISISSGLCSR